MKDVRGLEIDQIRSLSEVCYDVFLAAVALHPCIHSMYRVLRTCSLQQWSFREGEYRSCQHARPD